MKWLAADLKLLAGLRFQLGHIDLADDCSRWAAVKSIDQLLDGRLLARQMSFDAAVGAVADPAGDTQFIGLILGPPAEEDALYPAGHANMTADAHDYSSVRSGASSAFIPTTL